MNNLIFLAKMILQLLLAVNHTVMFVSLGNAQTARNVSEKSQMRLAIIVIKISLQVLINVFMIMVMMVKVALSVGHKMIRGLNLLHSYIE